MFLVGMEESGTTRQALRDIGVDAWSCDLQPARDASPYHIQDDIYVVAKSRVWKRALIHPVCTFLTQCGARHLYLNPGKRPLVPNPQRWEDMEAGAQFFLDMLALPFPVVCENPRMHPYALAIVGHPFCSTQPYLHGDKAMKETHFWRNHDSFLPLRPTKPILPPTYDRELLKAWQPIHYESPGPHQRRNRSKTFPGIAKAIAQQWGTL